MNKWASSPRLLRAGCLLAARAGARGESAGQPAEPPAPAAAPAADQTPIFRADINFVRRCPSSTTARQSCQRFCGRRLRVTEMGSRSLPTFKLINVSEDTGVVTDPPREVRKRHRRNRWRRRATMCAGSRFSGRLHWVRSRTACAARGAPRDSSRTSSCGRIWRHHVPLWSIDDVLLSRNRKQVASALR